MRASLSALVVLLALGCGNKKGEESKKSAAPPTIELRAVPASAQVVMGADVVKLAESRLVVLAVEQMYRRDPGLEKRINALRADCGLEPGRDIKRLVIGMGAAPDQVVLIAAGSFEETALANCLNKSMASGGGSVNSRQVDGRVLYKVETADRSVWLSVGSGGILAVSPSESFLRDALSSGAKVWDTPTMKPHLAEVDRSATLWGAGLVPPRTGAGLVKVTSGVVKAPPEAVFGTLALSDGLDARLNLVMSSPEDANAAASKAIVELALGATVAQRFGLGRLVSKVKAEANGKMLNLSISLSVEELNELLSRAPNPAQPPKALDTGGPSLQDSADQNPGN